MPSTLSLAVSKTLNKLHLSESENDRSLDVNSLCEGLCQNEVKELQVGVWKGDSWQSLLSPRRQPQLRQALQDNTSLEEVWIGWHIPKGRPTQRLWEFLTLLSTTTKLKRLVLALDKAIPLPLLFRFSLLQHLELRAVQLWVPCDGVCSSTRTASTVASTDSNTTPLADRKRSTSTKKPPKSPAPWSKANITEFLMELDMPNLKSLTLSDCSLDDSHVPCLVKFLHNRSQCPHLQALSLRGNRRLQEGFATVTRAAVERRLHRLDLSLCDMDPAAAHALANTLKSLSSCDRLGLAVSGNYRIPTTGLTALVQLPLRRLDLSHCDIADGPLTAILTTLVDSPLQGLSLRGCFSVTGEVGLALERVIRNNESLVHLDLSNETAANAKPTPLPWSTVTCVADALIHNYTMASLHWDVPTPQTTRQQETLSQLDFWLALNRAGRRILRQNDTRLPWSHVLAAVSSQPNQLHWLVRHGVDQF